MKHGFSAGVIITVLVLGGCNNHFHELVTPDDNKILSFTVPGQTGPAVITGNTISVEADKDTDIRSLIPKATVSRKASLLPLTLEYIQSAFPSPNVFGRAAEMYTRDDFADHVFDLIREDKNFNVPKLTIPIDFSEPVDFFVISGKGNIRRYTVYVGKGINPVTITGLGAADKAYDGTTTATITGTAVIEGLMPGDTVTVNYGTAAFENAAVGNNKTVTFSGFSLAGADAGNYTLSAQPESVTAAIFELSDSIAFTDPEPHIVKTYGDAAFTNAITDTHSGSGAITYSSEDETVATVDDNGTVTMHKAGTTTVTALKAADGEYAEDTCSYILTVEPKPVTISVSVGDKVYDGTTELTIDGTPQIDGLVGGDEVTVIEGTAEFGDKNADTDKPVSFTDWSLVGADAGNYTLSAQPTATADITAKSVTITGLGAADKQYDGTTTVTITGTTEIVGLVTGDTVTVNDGTASFADKNVGNGKTVSFNGWSLDGTDAGNYSLSAQPANVTVNITVKSVTITGLTAANKVYDRTTAATPVGGTINGSIGGDTVTVTNGTAVFADATVGNGKTVTFSGFTLGGANAGNYSLSAQPASVTANITAKPVTITGLSAADKVYDRTTTATRTGAAAISGLISGDTVTINYGTAAFANATVGNGKTVTFSGFTLGGANVGNYSLSAQPASVTANITAKSVTITGMTAANKQYDGTTTATPSGGTISGLISGDTVNIVNGTAAFANATAGNNKTVTFSGFTLGGANAGNYSLSAQPANVTANITVIPIDMVRINNGNFQMGSPTTETGRNNEDETRHQVTLSAAFYMGKYQVTQQQYRMVMGSNPSNFTSNPTAGETQEKRPVEKVSWYDAVEFCNKLSELEGYTPAYTISGTTVTTNSTATGYRLPTEAQWEYACRAGTTTAYHTGASISDTGGWYGALVNGRTHEVGLKTVNAWGLYDMHGNVSEWCWDWYADNYGGTGAQTNPTGPSSGTSRVRRGGSFSDTAADVRSARRFSAPPGNSYNIIGFRISRP